MGVERVFDVIFQQFQILYRSCRLWHMKSMRSVVLACVVVHNMVVLERKHRYTGTRVAELGGCKLPSHIVRINTSLETGAEHVHLWRPVAVPVESCADHQRLKVALMDYIWERKGETVGNGSMRDVDDFSRSEDE
jgi:Plant transposon protein